MKTNSEFSSDVDEELKQALVGAEKIEAKYNDQDFINATVFREYILDMSEHLKEEIRARVHSAQQIRNIDNKISSQDKRVNNLLEDHYSKVLVAFAKVMEKLSVVDSSSRSASDTSTLVAEGLYGVREDLKIANTELECLRLDHRHLGTKVDNSLATIKAMMGDLGDKLNSLLTSTTSLYTQYDELHKRTASHSGEIKAVTTYVAKVDGKTEQTGTILAATQATVGRMGSSDDLEKRMLRESKDKAEEALKIQAEHKHRWWEMGVGTVLKITGIFIMILISVIAFLATHPHFLGGG